MIWMVSGSRSGDTFFKRQEKRPLPQCESGRGKALLFRWDEARTLCQVAGGDVAELLGGLAETRARSRIVERCRLAPHEGNLVENRALVGENLELHVDVGRDIYEPVEVTRLVHADRRLDEEVARLRRIVHLNLQATGALDQRTLKDLVAVGEIGLEGVLCLLLFAGQVFLNGLFADVKIFEVNVVDDEVLLAHHRIWVRLLDHLPGWATADSQREHRRGSENQGRLLRGANPTNESLHIRLL